MPIVSETDKLDGTTAFSHFGTNYTWSNNYLGFLNVFGGNGPGTYVSTLNLASTGWFIQTLAFGSQGSLNASIRDLDANSAGTIDFLKTSTGDLTINLINSEIFVIQKFGSGNARITLGAADTSLVTLDIGNDTIIGGSGKIDHLNAGGGNNTIITGAGRVNSIITGDGIDRLTIGSGKAGSIETNGGNDVINTVNGRGDFIGTGDGNDTVTLGFSAARMVVTGDGNDTISLSAMNPNYGVVIHGDAGTDTINVSRFTSGVTLSLDQSGAWQDFGLVGVGYLSMIMVENAVGTAKNDNISGSADANKLIGGLGNDTLLGLDGADILIGGKGNDSLTGGAGADTFVFVAGDNTDHITDFTLGEDHIQVVGVHQLSGIQFAQIGTDVELTVGTALHILVENATVAALHNAANFIF